MAYKNFSIIRSNNPHSSNISSNDLLNNGCNVYTQAIKCLLTKSTDLKGETIVIKLPAEIINNSSKLVNFAENVHLLTICGINIIIIHDYSQVVDTTLHLLGLSKELKYKNNTINYRTTQIIEMVLVGHINQKVVSALCGTGCMAIGISGKHCNLIEARKAKVAFSNNDINSANSIIDLQFTSEPVSVNPEILINFEDTSIVTVISPVSSSPSNSTCLLDVDMTSSVIASSMTAKYLIFLDEFNQDNTFKDYSLLEFKELCSTKDCTISQCMLQATDSALNNNVEKVRIVNSSTQDALINGLFNDSNNIIEVTL